MHHMTSSHLPHHIDISAIASHTYKYYPDLHPPSQPAVTNCFTHHIVCTIHPSLLAITFTSPKIITTKHRTYTHTRIQPHPKEGGTAWRTPQQDAEQNSSCQALHAIRRTCKTQTETQFSSIFRNAKQQLPSSAGHLQDLQNPIRETIHQHFPQAHPLMLIITKCNAT